MDGTVENTEAAEEPTKLLNVSMPLDLFKRAITQCGLSVNKFGEDFNFNLLVINFLWSDVLSSLCACQNFLKECHCRERL